MSEYRKIGTTVYAVHKHYVKAKNKHGAKVIPCKIKGYENLEGTVVPMLKVIGGEMEVVSTAYNLYSTTEEAIKVIK